MYVTRQVKPKSADESFLSSLVHVDGGDAAKVIHRVLNNREPLSFFTHDKFTVLTKEVSLPDVLALLAGVKANHAVFGDVDGHPFVAAPYSKDRLVKNLIATARKFRSVKSGIRMIDTEHDLTNSARAETTRRDRVYKDD